LKVIKPAGVIENPAGLEELSKLPVNDGVPNVKVVPASGSDTGTA